MDYKILLNKGEPIVLNVVSFIRYSEMKAFKSILMKNKMHKQKKNRGTITMDATKNTYKFNEIS